jgi:hypothetical protein
VLSLGLSPFPLEGSDDTFHRTARVTLVGGTVATWPLAARGEQAGKVHRIGFLGSATSDRRRIG